MTSDDQPSHHPTVPNEASTREHDPKPRDPDASGRFIERFTLIMMETGFPRMPARVLVGLLTADAGRRTAGELAEVLRISPAAVSGAVRYLTQVGLVVREREPGRRSDHYRVLDDMWYEAITRRDEMMLRWETGLQEGVTVLGPETPAGARLEEMRLFFAFLRGEFPALLERWHALRAAAGGVTDEQG